jgi:hypothetical protein
MRPAHRYPALDKLMIRIGVKPPDTEFNRRAADYAGKAVILARGHAAWAKHPRNKKNAIRQ